MTRLLEAKGRSPEAVNGAGVETNLRYASA